MGSHKTPGKKKRLVSAKKRTRWAPFWLIPKVFGIGRRVHPARLTRVKRQRRRKVKLRP